MGTAMTQVMNKMSNAVADGGTDLEIFASAAGVTSEEFAKAFNDRPIEALGMLIKSLEESGMSAGEMNGALETLGIKGIREADAIKRLVGSSDMLTEATKLSSNAFKEGTALQDEASVRYETMASNIQELKNIFNELGIQLGEVLMPYVSKATEFIGNMAKRFTGLSDETKKMIVVIASIAASFGPLFLVLGTAVMWFGSLMKTIGPLMATIGKMGGITKVLGAAFTALTGPVGLTVLAITGLATAFGIAYAKSETFRNIVGGVLNGIKDVALIVKDAVVGFAQELFTKVKAFWQSDGEQVMQALQNAWTGVLKVVEFVAPAVSLIFKGLMIVIQMVWENIKGAINGALNVIMGLVKVFSGLFTGDFSKMWEGVKQIFTGAIQTVWNVFSLLFYGRIIKGVGSFVKIFSGSIRSLWTSVVGFFKNMFTGSVNQVTNLYNRATNIGNLIKNGLSGAIRGARDNVVNLFNSMRTRSLDQVNKILGGIRSLPSKMKDALIAGKNKVAEGIKSLGNSMAGTLGRVVNGVIGGINTVMEKIGIKKSISQWSVPKFSRGTGQGSPSGRLTRNGKIAMDTLATVGDKGPGNGKGTRELVHYPNGQVGLYDNDATIFAPKGTTIYNNKQTEELLGQLPKFSKGTGFWGNIKNIASKAFDYLTNPSKIFNAIVDNYMQAWNVGAFAKDLGKGAWKNMKSGLLEWVKARFSEAGTGKRQKWMDRYPITTPYSPFSAVPGYPRAFNGGRHYGIDWGTPIGVNLTSPVAGTVSRQSDHGGGNVARVDYGKGSMYFLHMNSVKPGKVGIGQSLGYSGNTGAFTTGPHVHVQDENPKTSFLQNRNTRNPLKMFKSHLNGGLIKTAGLFNLHPNEYVVPMDNPTNAMKLIALMSKELAGKSKQTNQLPNLMPSDNNRVEEKLDVMIELLKSLLMKDTDVYMDGKKMNDEFNEMNAIDAMMNF